MSPPLLRTVSLRRRHAGSGGDWSPLDIDGLALWLDASDLESITDSAGAVSSWLDKSNGHGFAQGAGSHRPSTGSATLNTLNVLTFDGDYLTTTAAKSTFNFLHGADKHVTLAVAKFTNAGNLYGLMGTTSSTEARGFGHRADYRFGATGKWLSVVKNNTGGGSARPVNFTSGDGVIPGDAWHLIVIHSDYANSTPANRIVVNVDGGSDVKGNSSSASTSTADSAYDLEIGAIGNGSSPLLGAIAEILCYHADLGGSEVQQVEDYLTSKWGV